MTKRDLETRQERLSFPLNKRLGPSAARSQQDGPTILSHSCRVLAYRRMSQRCYRAR